MLGRLYCLILETLLDLHRLLRGTWSFSCYGSFDVLIVWRTVVSRLSHSGRLDFRVLMEIHSSLVKIIVVLMLRRSIASRSILWCLRDLIILRMLLISIRWEFTLNNHWIIVQILRSCNNNSFLRWLSFLLLYALVFFFEFWNISLKLDLVSSLSVCICFIKISGFFSSIHWLENIWVKVSRLSLVKICFSINTVPSFVVSIHFFK